VTTKPRTRKAPAANGAEPDPVFAAIGEHKALTRESSRLEESCWTVRAEAEKKYGEWISAPNDWPGKTTVTPFYDRWHRAANAERKAAMRMARTKPTTLAGVAALVAYTRRDMMKNPSELSDWIPIALKTVAAALGAWPS
jgi:hypothetical protein